MGSSYGGAVALLYTSSESGIKALGLKSPASFMPETFEAEFGEKKVQDWKLKGYDESIGYNYDVYLDGFNYDIYAVARNIRVPCLITHGDHDEIVPFSQSQKLVKSFGKKPNFIVFRNGNHKYTANKGDWDKMANLFVRWFNTELKKGWF